MDERKYDSKLVDRIREKEYTENIDGIDILFKPVPDDDRPHAMDPRLFEIAAKKKAMFSQRAKRGWKLSNERFRPDKITYDLTEKEVSCDEHLIEINQNHMIDVYIYRRTDDEGILPVMIYLHGGGFTAGDMKLYANQMKLVAELSHAAVVFPEYRLAPENPFPAAVDDAFGTVQYIYDNAEELKIDPKRIMVAGDSAGGSLTNSCVLKDEKKMIHKIFELYPVFDSRNYHDIAEYKWSYEQYGFLPEHEEIARSRIERIQSRMDQPNGRMLNLYIQNQTDNNNPLVSALCAADEQLAKFPDTVIAYSEFDYLRLQDEYAARKLKNLNVKVKLMRYCGCDHGFLDMLGTAVQAEEACRTMADEIKLM